MHDDDAEAGGRTHRRVDRWLWFTRIIKSRTIAASLVSAGKVKVNKERISKPSHMVRPGDIVTATVNRRVWVLRVVGLGVRRGPAAEAQQLYEDLSPPPASAPAAGIAGTNLAGLVADGQRSRGAGRPSKRERRQLDRLKGRSP